MLSSPNYFKEIERMSKKYLEIRDYSIKKYFNELSINFKYLRECINWKFNSAQALITIIKLLYQDTHLN